MSDVADINILDNLFAKGAINLKTYISCYPDNAIANRQKLLDCINEEEQQVVNQLTEQLQQAQAQLQQAAETLKQQEQTINNAQSVLNENKALKEKLYALQAEYTTKMQQANKILAGVASRASEYYEDAKSMAGEVARARGLSIPQQSATNTDKQNGNPSV